ncbi:MAG: YigZ family protein [Flavobacteriales bacterium]|nr:YigZ family protein [Flavobacteriales bacterium]
MSSDVYTTIALPNEVLLKEKGSKHLGFSHAINSREEASELLKKYRELHPKANHVCSAYVLLNGEEYASDDGEPKNSAGPPILGQIKSKNLVNVLVVVIRYFGGTKLGIPGLIKAYKETAALVLDASEQKVIELRESIVVLFDYSLESSVKRLIHEHGIEIGKQEFNEKVTWELLVQPNLKKPVTHQLLEIHGLEII